MRSRIREKNFSTQHACLDKRRSKKMKLFGAKKNPQQQVASPQDAIQRLNQALENLEKREKHIQKRVEKELTDAKKLIAAKNKNGAKMALKRKKMYEVQLEKVCGYLHMFSRVQKIFF
jgi:U3 small nucleolar RNA-associated protein 14